MQNKPLVLVTGGAGYIGSVLVRLLLAEGYAVRVLDRLAFGGDSLLEVATHPAFSFINGDIRDEVAVRQALLGVQAVCHLAAIVGDPACEAAYDEATAINWTASVSLYEAAQQADVQQFVFASTCSNYGKMAQADGWVDEESTLSPVSHYARLKVQFEQYLLGQPATAICSTVLRFATVYGLSPRPRFDLTVNEFTLDVAMGKELLVYGEQFWRPYCHVRDLARAVICVLQTDPQQTRSQVFNVGKTTENYTKKMLVEQLARLTPDLRVRYVQRNEDPRDYRVNFDRIAHRLGYHTTRSLPGGMQELYTLIRSGLLPDPYARRFRNTA